MCNLKNTQVRELYPEQLATGHPFVIEVGDPKKGKDGKVYQQLYVAQEGNFGRTGSYNELDEMFLDWTGNIERCVRNAIPEKVKKLKIDTGTIFEGWSIEVTEDFNKTYPTEDVVRDRDGNPRLSFNPETGQDEEFYRHRKLIPYDKPNHTFLTLSEVTSYEEAFAEEEAEVEGNPLDAKA